MYNLVVLCLPKHQPYNYMNIQVVYTMWNPGGFYGHGFSQFHGKMYVPFGFSVKFPDKFLDISRKQARLW